jgi:hypothetical protein
MTDLEEYFDTVTAEILERKNLKADQCVGQWWFNRLYDFRPDVANQIRGTLKDPFHRDDVLDDFHERVMELW